MIANILFRHYEEWNQVWKGSKADGRKAIRKMYGPNNEFGYNATCDTPTCFLWDVLLDEFPEAKVIHVIRDDEKWASSVNKHIQVFYQFSYIQNFNDLRT